jgi:putative ABC transport system permease protein
VPNGAKLLKAVDFDGQPLSAGDGILLPRSEAQHLGVRRGQRVSVWFLGSPGPVAVEVTDIVETAMGAVATMSLSHVNQLLGLGGRVNTILVQADDRLAARTFLASLPGVASITDAAAIRAQLDQLLALNIAMVGMMLVFAGILGAAILYTTATLSILERMRELATFRALGMRFRRIVALVTIESSWLGAIGFLIGLPLSYIAGKNLLAFYDTDLFTLPFVWSWTMALLAVTGVATVLLFAQIPALRAVARINLAGSVRSREG